MWQDCRRLWRLYQMFEGKRQKKRWFWSISSRDTCTQTKEIPEHGDKDIEFQWHRTRTGESRRFLVKGKRSRQQCRGRISSRTPHCKYYSQASDKSPANGQRLFASHLSKVSPLSSSQPLSWWYNFITMTKEKRKLMIGSRVLLRNLKNRMHGHKREGKAQLPICTR